MNTMMRDDYSKSDTVGAKTSRSQPTLSTASLTTAPSSSTASASVGTTTTPTAVTGSPRGGSHHSIHGSGGSGRHHQSYHSGGIIAAALHLRRQAAASAAAVDATSSSSGSAKSVGAGAAVGSGMKTTTISPRRAASNSSSSSRMETFSSLPSSSKMILHGFPMPPPVNNTIKSEEGKRIASPLLTPEWAAFDDDVVVDEHIIVNQEGSMMPKPIFASDTATSDTDLDENQGVKELKGRAVGTSSTPSSPPPLLSTTTMDRNEDKDGNEDYEEEVEEEEIMADDGVSAFEEGREIGEAVIRRIERRQLRLGKLSVRPLAPPLTTSSSTATLSVPGAIDPTATVNTTHDTEAAIAPIPTNTTSRSMRVSGSLIKGSLTKKKKNIRGTSNSSSHSGSGG